MRPAAIATLQKTTSSPSLFIGDGSMRLRSAVPSRLFLMDASTFSSRSESTTTSIESCGNRMLSQLQNYLQPRMSPISHPL